MGSTRSTLACLGVCRSPPRSRRDGRSHGHDHPCRAAVVGGPGIAHRARTGGRSTRRVRSASAVVRRRCVLPSAATRPLLRSPSTPTTAGEPRCTPGISEAGTARRSSNSPTRPQRCSTRRRRTRLSVRFRCACCWEPTTHSSSTPSATTASVYGGQLPLGRWNRPGRRPRPRQPGRRLAGDTTSTPDRGRERELRSGVATIDARTRVGCGSVVRGRR